MRQLCWKRHFFLQDSFLAHSVMRFPSRSSSSWWLLLRRAKEDLCAIWSSNRKRETQSDGISHEFEMSFVNCAARCGRDCRLSVIQFDFDFDFEAAAWWQSKAGFAICFLGHLHILSGTHHCHDHHHHRQASEQRGKSNTRTYGYWGLGIDPRRQRCQLSANRDEKWSSRKASLLLL